MYNKNKSFRIKYFILTLAFIILSILHLLFYQNENAINFLLFTSIIMTTFLFTLYRPINNLKLVKLMKTSH